MKLKVPADFQPPSVALTAPAQLCDPRAKEALMQLITSFFCQITDPPPALRAPTSVLLSHLRARLRNSEPYYTMKLMIVGLANRGKTTLMHRINRDFSFSKNNSTQGMFFRKSSLGIWMFFTKRVLRSNSEGTSTGHALITANLKLECFIQHKDSKKKQSKHLPLAFLYHSPFHFWL